MYMYTNIAIASHMSENHVLLYLFSHSEVSFLFTKAYYNFYFRVCISANGWYFY